MGWSVRKSLRLLPGIRVNLSKSGLRLSVGVPGARASVGLNGKARIYGGMGPLVYRKSVDLGLKVSTQKQEEGFLASLRRHFIGAETVNHEDHFPIRALAAHFTRSRSERTPDR